MKGLNVLFFMVWSVQPAIFMVWSVQPAIFMVWSVQPAIFKHVCKAVVKSEYELYRVCLLAQNRAISTGQIFTKLCVWYFC